MNSNFSNGRKPDPETMLDELFQVKELAPDDFSARTLAAVRQKAKRAKILRFSARLSTAIAASMALFLGLSFTFDSGDSQQLADASASPLAETDKLAYAKSRTIDHGTTADELTLALQAAQEGHDVLFYSRALALEELLADAAALSDKDNEEALEFLTLLAEN